MEVGQRIHPGAHAQSQPTVFKAQRNEPEPAPILPRQMAVMNAWGWLKKRGSVPHRKMDALVRNSGPKVLTITFGPNLLTLTVFYEPF